MALPARLPPDDRLKLAEYDLHRSGDLFEDSYDRSSIAERYLRENVSCHVHIRLRHPGHPKAHEYCAEFYPVVKVRHLEPARLLKNPCREEQAGGAALNPTTRHHHYGRKPVLVGVRQIPEHLEGVKVQADSKLLVESVVGLKPLDLCDVGGVNFFEAALDGLGPIFWVTDDGKLGGAGVVESPVGVVQGELVHQVVEHLAEIDKDIPCGVRYPTKAAPRSGMALT